MDSNSINESLSLQEQIELLNDINRDVLHILDESSDLHDTIQRVVITLKEKTGFDAIGVRLQNGDDFPYFAQIGFSEDFLAIEDSLLERSPNGGICKNECGEVCLECTCGLVITGKLKNEQFSLTKSGSFWTNDSTVLLSIPPDQDPRNNPRNTCFHKGYKSVALIPIRNKEKVVGLIHINDHRENCFNISMIQFLENVVSQIGSALIRKNVERLLKERNDSYKVLFEGTSDAIMITDSYTRSIIMVNRSMCKMLGYTEKELTKMNISDIHPEEALQSITAMFNSVNEGAKHPVSSLPLLRKDGTVIYAELNTSMEMVAGKGCNIGIFRDISERELANEIMQRTQKLESLGVLAGGIAHDFNNLMSGVFGYIDIALNKNQDPMIFEYLTKAMKAIDRSRNLTHQLLTFSKGGAPLKRIENLSPFLQEAAQFALSGSNVLCSFDVQENLWLSNFDKNQIGQVVDNIVINAQQAMSNGGEIKVKAENFVVTNSQMLKDGDYIKISIQDAGIGMSKATIAKIFDPFFTTKDKGHGLGLATCYSIVNRHGGCIDVESKIDKGTTFHIYLPASKKDAVAIEDTVVQKHEGVGLFIVMDDEEIIQETISEMLISMGYSVICKKNGEDVLSYISDNNNVSPVGMIFDLTIPGGMGGKEVIVKIRKMGLTTPIYVASGYADDAIMRNPKKFGFTASISKPFRKADIMGMLNKG